MTDFDLPSTVPAVKAAVMGLLQGPSVAQALRGVELSYGDPGVDQVMREHIFLGGTVGPETDWATFGRLAQEEVYGLEVFVHVANPGWSQQKATERAYALAAVLNHLLRPLIRTPAKLGAGVYMARFAPGPLTEFVSTEGFSAFLSSQIQIKARV